MKTIYDTISRKSVPHRKKSKYRGSEARMSETCPSKSKNVNVTDQSELGAGWWELSLEKQAGSGHGEACWLCSRI